MTENADFAKDQFSVVLGRGVEVGGFNYVINNSYIGKNTRLKPFNFILDTSVGKDCVITSSKIESSTLEREVSVGPSANIRPQTLVRARAKVGAFVEIKKSTIGQGSKVPHLSYVGDAKIGKGCNIGCGVVFCNYDGKYKHQTTLKDGVFVGSNANLVAPLTLEKGAYVAAGSTITDNVPPRALAIARARQVNKLDYKRKD